MGGFPTRTIASIYLVAVATIFVVLVWSYCNLFKSKQLENPGLSSYRAPPSTMVHPLISVELVPGVSQPRTPSLNPPTAVVVLVSMTTLAALLSVVSDTVTP